MNFKRVAFFFVIFISLGSQAALAEKAMPETAPVVPGVAVPEEAMSVDDILNHVEQRYTGPGFTARFTQKSTIKAMDITDMAEGRVSIKRPGMMRWEYEKPEKQIIITNGASLWVYRPEDNQVMVGSAPAYFGDGKGASFLSDIRTVREKFTVSLEKGEDPACYRLKLLPKDQTLDISAIWLSVSVKEFNVEQIITHNSYEDETLIEMQQLQFNRDIDDAVFSFDIPEGADIVQLEE
ncbi:outer membrane lipoprotein carrier protein LolA [Desulfonema ishimotonii]|uniref:Outer membrane lipoprotein carrier protein LolA n=1 Tax=Desulfonema ishimotonii TaxID=45657 RepID=A0A401FV95_9BACT|nr:outer membrane lipoprotein carrier protein LolA [Desulfonema ishimotonii]GBC60881.1 outer membrane lipoprotein carrier protein LolA [Desulfonema ishimotonii]